MKKKLILNILVSTFNDRISQVPNLLLDERPDVKYFISHQYTDKSFKTIPAELLRDDVVISQIESVGVTKSRNNVMSFADGDIGLFSDDDVTYTHKYIDDLLRYFEKHPHTDVGLFKINTPEGYPEFKNYPEKAERILKLGYSVGTIEIAYRINKVRKAGIQFDERFGVGQPVLVGQEESIFVFDCIKEGLHVWFVPIYIVNHEFMSTIQYLSRYDKRRVSMEGAYDARINGWVSIPKSIMGSIKNTPVLIKHRKNPFVYFLQRFRASLFIIKTDDDAQLQ